MSRILILSHEFPPFDGGIATVALGLARGSATVGHETHVLAPAYRGDSAEWDGAEPYGITRFPGATASLRSWDKLSRYTRRCHREIRRLRPHIVHAVDPASLVATEVLRRLRLLGSTFFTVHGTELQFFLRSRLHRWWMGTAFREAMHTTTVSRAVHQLLLDSFGVPPDRATVAYPGVDPRWIREPPTDRARTRRGWGAGEGDLVLLTVARRVPEKGHDRVLAGLASLSAGERQRTLYVVAGAGPDSYGESLGRRAERTGVRLRLEGRLDDDELLQAYDGADLFVMLSRPSEERFEGLGLVYLEAASRGLPALACDTGGGVAEVVIDGETGRLLPGPADAEAVAGALRSLADDPGERSALGEAARARAESFDSHQRAAQLYRIFEAALESA